MRRTILGRTGGNNAETRKPFFAGNPRKVDRITLMSSSRKLATARGVSLILHSVPRSRPSKSRARTCIDNDDRYAIHTYIYISALLLGYLTRTAIVPRDKRARVRSRVGVSRRRLPPSVRKIPFSCTAACFQRPRRSVRTKFACCTLVV